MSPIYGSPIMNYFLCQILLTPHPSLYFSVDATVKPEEDIELPDDEDEEDDEEEDDDDEDDDE